MSKGKVLPPSLDDLKNRPIRRVEVFDSEAIFNHPPYAGGVSASEEEVSRRLILLAT